MHQYVCVYFTKQETGRHYTGCTKNVTQRLRQHNRGETLSTRHGCPWELICSKEFDSQEQAYQQKKEIKSYKGGNALKKILEGWQSG